MKKTRKKAAKKAPKKIVKKKAKAKPKTKRLAKRSRLGKNPLEAKPEQVAESAIAEDQPAMRACPICAVQTPEIDIRECKMCGTEGCPKCIVLDDDHICNKPACSKEPPAEIDEEVAEVATTPVEADDDVVVDPEYAPKPQQEDESDDEGDTEELAPGEPGCVFEASAGSDDSDEASTDDEPADDAAGSAGEDLN